MLIQIGYLPCCLGLATIVRYRQTRRAPVQRHVIGDVRDCDCIIIDDMIDTAVNNHDSNVDLSYFLCEGNIV